MENSKIFKSIISKENIYRSIYSLESYVFEKELLVEEDISILHKLRDKFDTNSISKAIEKVQNLIQKILIEDEMFELKVFFRPKKYLRNKRKIEHRPIHTADIYTQIALVSMLNVIIFDDHEKNNANDGKANFSDLVKLIPDNFYGNIPSLNSEYLFKPWAKMYKKYSKDTSEHFNHYLETKEYKYEVSLDLINFFPSINPLIILEIISRSLVHKYNGNENKYLQKMLFKMLYFKNVNIKDCSDLYYGNCNNNEMFSIGIVQGLP